MTLAQVHLKTIFLVSKPNFSLEIPISVVIFSDICEMKIFKSVMLHIRDWVAIYYIVRSISDITKIGLNLIL